MSVYIISDRGSMICKIGYSKNPLSRLYALRNASASKLEIEAIIPADMSCEKELHKTHEKSRLIREWFKITPDIEALISAFPYVPLPRKKYNFSRISTMKTQEVLKRYGSKVALARVLKISPQAISQWGENLPELQALKLEKIERENAA